MNFPTMNFPTSLKASNKARNLTLLGIAAGIVLVPIIRYAIRRFRAAEEPATDGAPPNNLFSAYRGKFKPHRRKAAHNGVH